MHGFGTYVWTTEKHYGDSYTGQWVHGKIHGSGTFSWKKLGTRFIGEYVNGKRQGPGVIVYSDGVVEKGVWENDKRVK